MECVYWGGGEEGGDGMSTHGGDHSCICVLARGRGSEGGVAGGLVGRGGGCGADR